MKTKNIWFKQIYVESILSGKKNDTFRKPNERVEVGQILRFSVGPRPPFAFGRVTAVNDLDYAQIEPEKQQTLKSLYGELPTYRQIIFELITLKSFAQLEE